MRKISILLFSLAAVCLFALPVLAFADAPPLSASEIANISTAEVSAINQEASWLWQLLISDYAVKAIDWILTVGVSVLIGWLGREGTRFARCVAYIAAGVRSIYFSFVRPAKQASPNGKLTEYARVKAMDDALEYARKIAEQKGLDLFRYLSKDVATAIAELFVRLFKGDSKKAEVLVPLPDSPPLPPSVTEGVKSASTSAVSG